MGIGGSGASAAAAIAHAQSYQVSGCDLKKQSQYLSALPQQIKFLQKHNPEHLNKKIDLLVVSPAILKLDPKNPELERAKSYKIPVLTWQQFMGRYLQKGKTVIAVAGTHGKSTTTAMIGHILKATGLDPTVEIGANDLAWQANFRVGKGEYFVCEADEYNNNFLNYKPNYAVVTNIELDHPDFFNNEEKLFLSFKKFVNQIQSPGFLFLQPEQVGIARLIKLLSKNVQIISCPNKQFELQILGSHNQHNASLAACLAHQLKIKDEVINKTLAKFAGVAQRLEKKGQFFGADLYSDYAVHPTEVKRVLKTLQSQYPTAKIFAVFEPHTFSRLSYFFEDFVRVFSNSKTKVLVTDVFAAREKKGRVDASDLANALKNATYLPFPKVANYLKNGVGKSDVVVVMGAGDSYKIVDSLLKGVN